MHHSINSGIQQHQPTINTILNKKKEKKLTNNKRTFTYARLLQSFFWETERLEEDQNHLSSFLWETKREAKGGKRQGSSWSKFFQELDPQPPLFFPLPRLGFRPSNYWQTCPGCHQLAVLIFNRNNFLNRINRKCNKNVYITALIWETALHRK